MILKVFIFFISYMSFAQMTFKSEGFQDWNKRTTLVLEKDGSFVFLAAETDCGFEGYRCTKITGSFIMNDEKLELEPIFLLKFNVKNENIKLNQFNELNSDNFFYKGKYIPAKNLVYKKRDLFVKEYDVILYNNTKILMNPNFYNYYLDHNNSNLEEYNDYVGLSNGFNYYKDINFMEKDNYLDDNYFKTILRTKLHTKIDNVIDKGLFKECMPKKHQNKFHVNNVKLKIVKTKNILGIKYEDWDENDNVIIKRDKFIELTFDKGRDEGVFIGMAFKLNNNKNECYDFISISKVEKNKSYAVLYDIKCDIKRNTFVTQSSN